MSDFSACKIPSSTGGGKAARRIDFAAVDLDLPLSRAGLPHRWAATPQARGIQSRPLPISTPLNVPWRKEFQVQCLAPRKIAWVQRRFQKVAYFLRS